VTPFCLGIVCGAVVIAAIVVVGSHMALELADGNLAEFLA